MKFGNGTLIFDTATELVIASDAITITQGNHKLQPESSTADNLSTINGTVDGEFGILYVSDFGTDTITIKHNVGNILCVSGADVVWSNGALAWYSIGTKVLIFGDGAGSGGVTDGDKGDVTVSVGGTVWTIDNNAVSLAKLATQAANTILAEATGSTAVPTAVAVAANKFLARASTGNIAAKDITDFALTILDDANAAAVTTTIGAVAKTLYDAHSILYATTDDTPTALTVGEQTVVGRITGGNIAALTVAELAALTLSAALPENTAVILDAALSADGKYSGIVEAGTAGATLAFGDLCYLAVADSRWELVDANAAATSFGKLGMCVLAAAGDASATTILLYGKIRADTAFPALTIGAPVFASTTAGDVQTTAPSGAADIIRIVGYGNTADELYFNPSNDYFEHV